MKTLNDIYSSIGNDLEKVRQELQSLGRVDFPWLSEQLDYVVQAMGKGIRPALTLLAGKFYRYDLSLLLPMAVSAELMHTATLVHDDAIDKSAVRRGQATINQLFGDDVAVLLGDYLFAKAGEYVADTKTPRVIKLFSQTLATISSGEIIQFLCSFKLAQTRDEYFKRIYGKTASLFALATESGAVLSQAPPGAADSLKRYGESLGIAFQIVDDILDFTGTEETLGKPAGSDLTQGTLTLPAMMLNERFPEYNPVKSLFETREPGHVTRAIEMVQNSDIVEECYRVAREYADKASGELAGLPEAPARKHLSELADFVLTRRD